MKFSPPVTQVPRAREWGPARVAQFEEAMLRRNQTGSPRWLALGCAALLFFLPHADAAIIVLGHGLRYLRVSSVAQSADELRSAAREPSALIIDLRYPANESDGLEALRALGGPATQAKLYLLVSPETPRAVAEAVRAVRSRAVVLGVKGSHPEPHVTVEQTRQDDRAAYEASAKGTALPDLISGKIDKERFDEASLVQEFKSGNHDARPPAKATGASKSPRQTDRVLQRAVHLHRALQALKRG